MGQQELTFPPALPGPDPPVNPDLKSCTRCPCPPPVSSLVQIAVEPPPVNTTPRRLADSVHALLLWHCWRSDAYRRNQPWTFVPSRSRPSQAGSGPRRWLVLWTGPNWSDNET